MTDSRRIPRWVKVLISTVIVLTVLFYGVGGFVFANMIHDDLLVPLPPSDDYGVYAIAADESSITLTSGEERVDTLRPGVAGLVWDGGRGQIGEIAEIEGLNVTRSFVRTDGGPPPICAGTLDSCEQVDIDSWVFEDDPEGVGLEFEDVEFPSSLGDMPAWRVDAGDGSVWVIHAHGWRASGRETLRTLPIYHQAGVTSLVIDYRNDEGAPADPSGLYHFGSTEWKDIEAAVQYALDEGATKVILHGYSTGAALDLAFLENSDLASSVTANVFDSPNADTEAALRLEAGKRSIPGTSFPIPRSLITVAMFVADMRWDVGWDEIDYVSRVDHIVSVPTLVFHGTEDDRVPIEVARDLRDASPDLVELVETEKAGHVTSWNIDPDGYADHLSDFLQEVGARS